MRPYNVLLLTLVLLFAFSNAVLAVTPATATAVNNEADYKRSLRAAETTANSVDDEEERGLTSGLTSGISKLKEKAQLYKMRSGAAKEIKLKAAEAAKTAKATAKADKLKAAKWNHSNVRADTSGPPTSTSTAPCPLVTMRSNSNTPDPGAVVLLINSLDEVRDEFGQDPETTSVIRDEFIEHAGGCIQHAVIDKPDLNLIMPAMNIPNLRAKDCREILRVLNKLGDILWYKDTGSEFKTWIILNPTVVLDFVRQVVDHNYVGNAGESYDALRHDGTLQHSLLMASPFPVPRSGKR
ncbi:hypothetical protein BBO99_00002341 [Phytophthora kernoviae]|uniref:RxLR effector protein n=1 Tax=Phytophthora kernoviae TaxID=325452 RepID=A0A3R7KMF9_9STRA|nr:hypothetical protein BBI17_002287 [Phytophthora kernoviae]RLN83154.1 hypothetical protein BBO99_00002341 [Phytophthora kernoviae]